MTMISDTRSFSGMNYVLAFAAGALAGTAVALLTAPRTGRETRDAINYWTREIRDKASRIPRAARQAVERGREAGKQAFTESYHGDRH
jgi:gas vesicle protein